MLLWTEQLMRSYITHVCAVFVLWWRRKLEGARGLENFTESSRNVLGLHLAFFEFKLFVYRTKQSFVIEVKYGSVTFHFRSPKGKYFWTIGCVPFFLNLLFPECVGSVLNDTHAKAKEKENTTWLKYMNLNIII